MNSDLRERIDNLKDSIAELKNTSDVIAEAGITIEDKPAGMLSRPGYKWTPHQNIAGGAITWVETESEDKTGTADEPIVFVPGMAVYPNYYYTDGIKRYVCLRAGTPNEIGEGTWFTEF